MREGFSLSSALGARQGTAKPCGWQQ